MINDPRKDCGPQWIGDEGCFDGTTIGVLDVFLFGTLIGSLITVVVLSL